MLHYAEQEDDVMEEEVELNDQLELKNEPEIEFIDEPDIEYVPATPGKDQLADLVDTLVIKISNDETLKYQLMNNLK